MDKEFEKWIVANAIYSQTAKDGAWLAWQHLCHEIVELRQKLDSKNPIPMVLYCPSCRTQHIDEGEWETKEHRSHQCESCNFIWRPVDVPTVGVEEIKTKGSQDSVLVYWRKNEHTKRMEIGSD